jgi:hypothetical protein
MLPVYMLKIVANECGFENKEANLSTRDIDSVQILDKNRYR